MEIQEMKTKFKAVDIISNEKSRTDFYARFTTVPFQSSPGQQLG